MFLYKCFTKIHVSFLCSYMKTILAIVSFLINVTSHFNKIVKQLMISISCTIMQSTFPRIICCMNIKIKFIYKCLAQIHVSFFCSYMETMFTISGSLIKIASHFKKILKQFPINIFYTTVQSSSTPKICHINIKIIFLY